VGAGDLSIGPPGRGGAGSGPPGRAQGLRSRAGLPSSAGFASRGNMTQRSPRRTEAGRALARPALGTEDPLARPAGRTGDRAIGPMDLLAAPVFGSAGAATTQPGLPSFAGWSGLGRVSSLAERRDRSTPQTTGASACVDCALACASPEPVLDDLCELAIPRSAFGAGPPGCALELRSRAGLPSSAGFAPVRGVRSASSCTLL
jgi:hypothetical protein